MKTFPELLEEANAEIKSVSPEELKQQLDNEEIILVDVRSKEAIEAEGQIEGSVHVPRDMLEFHADQRPDNPLKKEELDPEKKIVVYCGVGGQGTLSTKTLQDMGYKDVSNLSGGTSAWVKAGFELKK
ncbi:rhodanese-like domain-containing protein [Alphaproteobacteria bacterium]|nr:rhodanese-like domain-containing protein [Alphaproteobacteria bacterium]